MAIFYLCLCAMLFQVSIKWYSEMQLGVKYLKHGVAQNAMWHSGHLDFILAALFIAELRQQFSFLSLPFQTQCFVSSLFSWLDNGACSLLRCDLSLRHPAHLLYYVPHQHTPGIISNHKMQHINTCKLQNVRNLV